MTNTFLFKALQVRANILPSYALQLLEPDLHRCLHAYHYYTAHRLKIHMFCSYGACSKMFYKIKLTTKFYKWSNCLLSSVVIRVLSFLILALFSVIIRKYGQD